MIDQKKFVRASSVRRALGILGDVSTLLIIGGAFLRARRFDDFLSITMLQKSVLSDRLSRLCDAGILRKHRFSPDSPRQDYRLTQKGAELQGIALLLLAWEDKWDTQPDALYRIQLVHRDCGEHTRASPKCSACGQEISDSETLSAAGPGESFVLAQHPRQRRPAPSVAKQHARSVLPGKLNSILGDRWSALVIDSMFAGHTQFDALTTDIGIATNILTERLRVLVQKSIVERTTTAEAGRRSSVEYALTKQGLELRQMFLAMQAWGDRWLGAPEGAPELSTHKPCGAQIQMRLACDKCHGELDGDNVEFRVVHIETGAYLESWRGAVSTEP